MIHFIDGKIVESLPNQVVLDVQGVGYLAHIPLSTYDRLPAQGERFRLLTHFHVREDAQMLFGFASDEERDLFQLLIQRVSGVGPKVALAVLSGMSVSDFKNAVVQEDVTAISRTKGLGKKTSERIVLELKDKVGVADAWKQSQSPSTSKADNRRNDAVLALISLGYKRVDALKAVEAVCANADLEAGPDEILRQALRHLN